MSHHSKTPLGFGFAAALWLAAIASAFAQDAPDITLKLSPAEVAEITRLIDLQPISISPPVAYWDLQTKLSQTLEVNPAALFAVISARSAGQ
jgi:hypothetical protein